MKDAAAIPHTRKDFLSILDFEPAEFERCLELAAQIKAIQAEQNAEIEALLSEEQLAKLNEARAAAAAKKKEKTAATATSATPKKAAAE